LDYALSGLQKRYELDAVKIENVVGKLSSVNIKYSDKPFVSLYTATPRRNKRDVFLVKWYILCVSDC